MLKGIPLPPSGHDFYQVWFLWTLSTKLTTIYDAFYVLALVEAIKAQNTTKLRRLKKYIEQKRYVSHMQYEFNNAKEVLRGMKRIENLKGMLLNLDAARISEIGGNPNPHKVVHEVMMACLLLLGDDEGTTRVNLTWISL